LPVVVINRSARFVGECDPELVLEEVGIDDDGNKSNTEEEP
jgi:hypothetical protein